MTSIGQVPDYTVVFYKIMKCFGITFQICVNGASFPAPKIIFYIDFEK